MSIEKGRAYFRALGMEDRVQEFTVSSATVELAALALGVDGARIAKTLSFKTENGCMLILAAGDARIDNHKFKDKFHFKAKMLSADEVLELVGHPVGGVCPFGINDGIPVYLDVSLKRFETVFPAVGSANSAIELNLDELFKYAAVEYALAGLSEYIVADDDVYDQIQRQTKQAGDGDEAQCDEHYGRNDDARQHLFLLFRHYGASPL